MADTTSSGTFQGVNPQKFLEKLCNALTKQGDFPVSAKVVSDLKVLADDPRTSANQITELILGEPSLGIRILHLVNSAYYARTKPIMTVSQAVIQVGMKPLSELCSGLVLFKQFANMARRGGPFIEALQRTVCTGLLSRSISDNCLNLGSNAAKKNNETGYLAGVFAEIGTLLVAYYFPQVYENAVKRSDQKGQDVAKSLTEIIGMSPSDLSIGVLKSLNLPPFYTEVIAGSTNQAVVGATRLPNEMNEIMRAAKAVGSARALSHAIVSRQRREDLDSTLNRVAGTLKVDLKVIQQVVGRLSSDYQDQCRIIELTLPSLPGHITDLGGTSSAVKEDKTSGKDEFLAYVEEIQKAIDDREPTAAIITSVMETLAWGLGFSRVMLLLFTQGKKTLVGRMILGKADGVNVTQFSRPVGPEASPYSPEIMALRQSRAVFNGEALLKGGWPITAIPVGFGARSIGVIYADMIDEEMDELPPNKQAAIGLLTELLDRSITAMKS